MNPYLTNKAAMHPDRLAILKAGGQPVPVHVLMVLSDLCNQDCDFCLYRIDGHTDKFSILSADGTKDHNPRRMMATEKAIEIICDAADMGVKAIQFTGGGEPTVHPDCDRIMRVANAAGLDTGLVTNGVRLDRIRPAALGAKWIRVSLDAGRRETYRAERRVPDNHWDVVLRNVSELMKERNGDGSPVVGVSFVVNRTNYHEVVEACRIARDLGADNFRIAAMIQPEDAVYFRDFHDEARDLVEQAKELSTESFEVISLYGQRLEDFTIGHPDYRDCSYQHLTTYIGADLNVYHCCITAYTERGTAGSLKDQSFRSFWNSFEKQERYGTFDARGCPRCQFNAQNRDIARMIESLPVLHGNFV